MDTLFPITKSWYSGLTITRARFLFFVDALAVLHSTGAAVVHTQESTRAQEAAKKISLDSEIESSIQASFNTLIPSILIENKRETTEGAYECLIGYIKDFTIWHPHGAQCSSGLRSRIHEGTKTVTGRLKKLRSTLTTDPELNEMAVSLSTDYFAFISEYLEFFTSQYEEYVETSTFHPAQALNTVLDLSALIFRTNGQIRSS
jgi:hypothetical protein